MDCHSPKGLRNDREADSKVESTSRQGSKANAESTSKSDSKILQEKAEMQNLDSKDREARQADSKAESTSKDEGVETKTQDSRRQDFGDKNGALQADSWEHTQAYVTEAEAKQSPFLAQKPTPQEEIILDFFAGSGTTAHAVMELNAQDGGNRKCILVQLDEEIDESKSKTAYDFCKNELGSTKPVISDITIERVKRAGERIKEAYKDTPLHLGFSVFSMVEKPSLISDESGSLELREQSELSPRDKARNLSLFDGKMLHLELQEIIKDSLYQCEQSLYVVALSDAVLAHLRESKNEKVYISGYDIASLEAYKNLESFLSTRLQVVY